MNSRLRKIIGALSLALAVPGCSLNSAPPAAKQQPVANTETATDAPVTAGYEAAIVAHAMKPIVRPRGTAPAFAGPGDRYYFLATGEETNNAFFQFEATVPSGAGPPPHIHRREDETFYIVSGSLEILIGDSTYQAKAGDFVFVPRGTVHRFKNVSDRTAVQLVTFVPAGMERFFREVFPPVTDPKAAPLPITDELIRKMNEAAPKHGMELLLPPTGGKK